MDTLQALWNKFRAAEMPKSEYIKEMYTHHRQLFAYADLLQWTEISSITIKPGELHFCLGTPEITLVAMLDDQRMVAINTLNFGSYEATELEIMVRLAEGAKTIFDIGGNVGWYSLNLAKRYPTAKILAFEPVPKTFAQLKRHVALNNTQNVQIFNFGFSEKPGQIQFFVDPRTSVSASARDLSVDGAAEKILCEMTTLDQFCVARSLQVDFIKCDVEGGELLVLRGGMRVLAEAKPVIFAEMLRKWSARFDYHPNDIISLLSTIGYECFVIAGIVIRPVSEVTDSTTETNFIFLHRERHATQRQQLVRS